MVPAITHLDDFAHCYEYVLQERPSVTTTFRASKHIAIFEGVLPVDDRYVEIDRNVSRETINAE